MNTPKGRLHLLIALTTMLWFDGALADSPNVALSPNPLVLGTSGCAAGTTCGMLVATPTPVGMCSGGQQTGVNCTVIGDTQTQMRLSFTPDSLFFECTDTMPRQIAVQCMPASADLEITLQCTVSRISAGSKDIVQIPVTCPALTRPEFSSNPAANATININATIGGTATATVAVSNVASPGQGALAIGVSDLTAPLSIAPTGTQADIAPGGSRNYTITCAPTQAGTFEQALTLTTNDVDEPTATYTVRCITPAPGVPAYTATPDSGALTQIVTTRPTNATTTISVTNSGTASLTVGPVSDLVAPFSLSPPSATIAPGVTAPLTVTCDGGTAGSFVDNFTLPTNDPNEQSVAYQASCVVQAPEIDSNPAPGSSVGLATTTGGTDTDTIAVSNTGNGTLQVTASGLSAPLSLTTPANFSVNASQGANVGIACSSGSVTSVTQTLTLTSNDQDEPSVTYSVRCDVTASTAPEFSADIASPGPITISTPQGTNGTRQLTVRNVGTANLTVAVGSNPTGTKITIAPNAAAGNVVLVPNATQAYTLTCDASAAGTFPSSFTLTSSDTDESSVPYNVSCTVTATAPEYTSTPAAPGSFALFALQGTNATQTFNVRNDGSATLTISSVTGATAPISVAPAGVTNILPGNSTNFTVTCAATNTGSFSSGFTVNTNDTSEAAVAYSANCTVAPRPPEFDSTPAGGTVLPDLSAAIGQTSTTTITVSNVAVQGPANLSIVPGGLNAPLSVSPGSLANIAVGANQPFVVTCAPTSGGKVTQTLVLDTNDSNEDPVTYTASCTGLAPEFTSMPAGGASVSLLVVAGTTSSFPLRVKNDGATTLNVTPSGLNGALSVAPGSATPIAPGNQTDFVVSCNDTVVGSITQTLTLTHNDANESPTSYSISCRKFLAPEVSRAVKAILTSQALPPPNLIFGNGFE